MSLEVLLADFPEFSARRIRRLAKYLRYLHGLNSKEGREIAAELSTLTLFQARMEQRLSDSSAMATIKDEPNVAG